MPQEINSKRILAIYIKIVNSKEKVLLILFEGGTLASFKLEEIYDDLIAALSMVDDDLFLDILIPLLFAIASGLAIFFKRRMA